MANHAQLFLNKEVSFNHLCSLIQEAINAEEFDGKGLFEIFTLPDEPSYVVVAPKGMHENHPFSVEISLTHDTYTPDEDDEDDEDAKQPIPLDKEYPVVDFRHGHSTDLGWWLDFYIFYYLHSKLDVAFAFDDGVGVLNKEEIRNKPLHELTYRMKFAPYMSTSTLKRKVLFNLSYYLTYKEFKYVSESCPNLKEFLFSSLTKLKETLRSSHTKAI